MIVNFRSKSLERLFLDDDRRGVRPDMVSRIRLILGVLGVARTIEGMGAATFRLHPLKGDLKGSWSVTVRANWRIVFRFEDGNAFDVDLMDYH